MTRRCLFSMLFISLLCPLLPGWAVVQAADPPAWVHWRGPSGQGYTDDQHVPLTWSETNNLLWKTKLPGAGNSSPIVWGDRVFLTGSTAKGQDRLVFCIRTTDGKILWQQTAAKGVAPEKSHSWNGYASPSCTTDGKYVYAFFGTPGLFCYDFDGKLIWSHSFGVFTSSAGWGTAASPFLFEDLVIQNCDNDGPKALASGAKPEDIAPMALVALDKATGKVRWITPRNQGRGFSTPRLMPVAGGRLDLVLNGPRGVWGYEPRTGKELWHCLRAGGEGSLFGEPLPVSDGDMMFIESGRPGKCLAFRLPGAGDVTPTHVVWDGKRKGRDVASPLLWQGLLYAADSKGSLTCYDWKTGKELNSKRIDSGSGKSLGSPILVRGKILWVLDDGVTVVQEPGPDMKMVGRNRLGESLALDFGASPAVVDGKLYIRSQFYLYCVGEKK